MANYLNQTGAFFGNVMLQASAKVGGTRSVFVDLTGVKNDLSQPTFGGQLKNPFKVPAKFYAGDLFELRYDNKGENPELYLLKTFKVKSQSAANVNIYRDGYSHVPCVGDVLMKAPDKIGAKGGKGYTITKVVEANEGGDDVWTITFNTAIDTVTDGAVLVEAEAENATATMLVKNINTVAPSDGDFVYSPATGATTATDDARMYYTPMMHGTMYIHKMSALPACVLALNKSRFNGWYEV